MFGFGNKTKSWRAEDWFESAKRKNQEIHKTTFSDGLMPFYDRTLRAVAADLQKAIELKPDYAGAWFNKACVHWILAEHAESLSCCEAAVKVDPSHANALLCIANVKRDKGEMDEAAAFYQRAVTSNPSDATAWYQFSAVLEEIGDKERATEALERALRLNSDPSSIPDEEPWLRLFGPI